MKNVQTFFNWASQSIGVEEINDWHHVSASLLARLGGTVFKNLTNKLQAEQCWTVQEACGNSYKLSIRTTLGIQKPFGGLGTSIGERHSGFCFGHFKESSRAKKFS
jgi:hypothetical protein